MTTYWTLKIKSSQNGLKIYPETSAYSAFTTTGHRSKPCGYVNKPFKWLMHSPVVAHRKCNQRTLFCSSDMCDLHSQSPPEACKDRITTKTQTAGGMKTSLPEVHAHYTHACNARLLEEWQRITTEEKKNSEKNKWAKPLGEKTPYIIRGGDLPQAHSSSNTHFKLFQYWQILQASPQCVACTQTSHNTTDVPGKWLKR